MKPNIHSLNITSFSHYLPSRFAGLVPKRSGQIQTKPPASGEHGCGQGLGRVDHAWRNTVRTRLGDLQRLHEPVQHPYHPHRPDEPHNAHRNLRTDLRARQPGRSRMPESIAEHLNQPLLMLRSNRHLHNTSTVTRHLLLLPHGCGFITGSQQPSKSEIVLAKHSSILTQLVVHILHLSDT